MEPSLTASQAEPKIHYVYGHFDEQDILFFIGKGTGRRAWNNDRDPLWHRFIQKHLNGKYSVVILADNLKPVEEIKYEWITQESEALIN